MFRIGIGTDRHRLAEGRKLIIGGVTVEFTKGAVGHSDADVLCHAVTDAILGAAGLGDIGTHFPDNDPAWKDADSVDLLVRAVAVLEKNGFRPVNVDASVHLERPKLGKLKVEMAANIARALNIPVDRVNIKAKTGEGVDAVGTGQAIEAVAIAMVETAR